MFNFIIQKRKYLIVLLVIICLSAFVRLYRITDYMHFLGDEGRDVLVVKRIIKDHQFTLLGPITSVGSMYLGPIYYYMMAPFLFIFNMNPVGPAVMIALLSILTIMIIYILGIEFFDFPTSIIASLLYAFSPLVIVYSRFSWNPNAVPFFALLIIYSLLKIAIKKQDNWSYICGLSLGVILQLHYLSLMFIPIILIVLAVFRKLDVKLIIKIILSSLITFSPFILFEFRHNFPNLQTVLRFITIRGNAATFALNKVHFLIFDLTIRAFWRIVVIENETISKLLILLILITAFLIFKNRQKVPKHYYYALIILFTWFIFTILSLALYQGAIYDYYLVQFFPLPAILTGLVLGFYIQKKGLYRIISWLLFFLLLFFQLKNSPLLKEPNRLLTLTQERARFIYNQVDARPYNFALITGSNSDHAYRYFLELWGKPPVTINNPVIDPERKTVTDQLFVLCEIPDCSPLGHPLWEIAGFGRADIKDSWEVAGVKILKLTHHQE